MSKSVMKLQKHRGGGTDIDKYYMAELAIRSIRKTMLADWLPSHVIMITY